MQVCAMTLRYILAQKNLNRKFVLGMKLRLSTHNVTHVWSRESVAVMFRPFAATLLYCSAEAQATRPLALRLHYAPLVFFARLGAFS